MQRILSCDFGFGHSKVAILEDGVVTVKMKELDSVVELTTDASYSDLKIINDDIFEYDGKKFLVGGNALQAVGNAAKVLDVSDYETFKYVTPLLLKKYMKRFKGDFQRVMLSISTAFYERSGDYKEFVSKKAGIPASHLFVLPQSAAGKLCIDHMGLDINNPSIKTQHLNYLIIDGGFQTLDIAQVINGKLMPMNIKGYAGMGVVKIAEQLIPYIKELTGKDISVSKARQLIESRKYVLRGKPYDISEFIEKAVNNYVLSISKFLEEKYSEQMDNIDNIIIFGGLAELIRSKMDVWDSIYNKNFVKIPVDNSEYYNVIGALFCQPKEK
ncbi:MAG: plasmid segregation protein ParM [Paludibacteraceae bacterium]|nr:plasmid segregation protein ParM [Paludibacteraceae bacterium]